MVGTRDLGEAGARSLSCDLGEAGARSLSCDLGEAGARSLTRDLGEAGARSLTRDLSHAPVVQTLSMLQGRRLVLVLALAASTLLTLALGVTDPLGAPGYPSRFLAWNLFLAWIPLVAAFGFTIVQARWARLVSGAIWLAFLPNAPYLVTDLVHLGRRDDERWRHILEFGFAAWTGVLLGVVSLRVMHGEVERRLGRVVGWSLVAMSTALCAIGVVIGRFQRWNSWDLVVRPTEVAATTIDWVRSPITNVRDTGVALAVAFFFGIAYVTIWALAALDRPASDRPASDRPTSGRRRHD